MKANDILRWILYAGIFLVPFLVFPVISDFFFPFITSKAFLFRILVEILVVVYAILALRDKAYRPKMSGIALAILAFLLAITISSFFGADFSQSFWSDYERMMGIVAYIHFFVFFVIIASVLKTREVWHGFFATSLAVSLVVGLDGFSELADTDRIDASLGNPIYLAAYALLNIFIAGFLFENARRHFRENLLLWFYAFAGVFNAAVLFFTGTRGTMLGVLGGIFLASLLVALFERKQKTVRKVAIGICAVFVLLPLVFLTVKDTDFVQNSSTLSRFANISIEEGTGGARIDLWEMAWDGFKERPVFGYGLENYELVFAEFYQPELYDEESWFDRAHSVVFNWLTVAGVLGLIGYLAMFGAFVLSVWNLPKMREYLARVFPSQKEKNSSKLMRKIRARFGSHEDTFSLFEKSILTGLVAAYFVHGLFVFEDTVSFILFFAVLAFVHAQITVNRPSFFGEKDSSENAQSLWAVVLIILMLVTFYFVNWRPLQANLLLSNALQSDQATEKLEYFERALSFDTFGNEEVGEQIVLEVRELEDGVPQETLRGYYALGQEAMTDIKQNRPTDPRPSYFLALLHTSFQQPEQALASINRALSLSPDKQQFLNLKVQLLVDLERYQEARETAQKSYELETSNQDAFDTYVETLIYEGDEEQAEELLEEKYGTTTVPRSGIINAYASQEDYDRLIDLWQKRVQENPENMQARLSLIFAYYQDGQNEEAIAGLEEIKERQPRFAEQIDRYIADIRAGRDIQE